MPRAEPPAPSSHGGGVASQRPVHEHAVGGRRRAGQERVGAARRRVARHRASEPGRAPNVVAARAPAGAREQQAREGLVRTGPPWPHFERATGWICFGEDADPYPKRRRQWPTNFPLCPTPTTRSSRHRRGDDAPAPRQAPPGLRRQLNAARGHRVGRQADRGGHTGLDAMPAESRARCATTAAGTSTTPCSGSR